MARSLTSWAATALLGGNSAGWLQGFFVYKLYLTGDPFNIFMAMLAGPVFHAYMHAPQSAIMSERAPTRMCNSGLSFGYQVTDIVAVSFAPIIAVFLTDKFDWAIPIAIYATTAAVISLIALAITKEARGIDFAVIDRADEVSLVLSAVRKDRFPKAGGLHDGQKVD